MISFGLVVWIRRENFTHTNYLYFALSGRVIRDHLEQERTRMERRFSGKFIILKLFTITFFAIHDIIFIFLGTSYTHLRKIDQNEVGNRINS